MKYLPLIIVLILPFSLLAQEVFKKNSINLSTGIAVGSSTSKYYVGDNHYIDLAIGAPTRGDYPKEVAAALNYRFGIDYQHTLGRGFFLKGGLRVASWNLTTTSYSNEKSILNNLFLEIPLAVQYRLGQKKWQPYFELGINPMIRVAYNNYSTSATFAIQTGFGLSYQLSQKISLYGQLSGRFQPVESINFVSHEGSFYTKPSGRYVYPFEVGLEVGIAFAF
jgi:hypothetical protein